MTVGDKTYADDLRDLGLDQPIERVFEQAQADGVIEGYRPSLEVLRKRVEEIHKRYFSEASLAGLDDVAPSSADAEAYFNAISELRKRGWSVKFSVSARLEPIQGS
jgi:hypothetical protein